MLNIKKLVESIVVKYNTNNPYELCDYLHIQIIYEDLGSAKGFYQSAPKNKFIHINNNLGTNDMLFTVAHELGHATMHAGLNILFLEHHTNLIKNRYEIEADTFAAELLIDDNLLLEYSGHSLDHIALCENLNPKYLIYKFKTK